VTGTVRRHAAFASKFVEPRNVDVWLPPGYEREPKKRYPVLYMHDGQNLFDPATSYGGVDWGVDEIMTKLIAGGEIREAIVVGVWNSPKRFLEYMPQKAVPNGDASALEGIPVEMKGPILSDAYLKFLVHELKPFVDATYRTRTGRGDTFVMGSSMGGLISLYALCEYPKVFGGAGCVSTHWPAGDGSVIEYAKRALPRPGSHKIYFDFGTETLDAKYEPYQLRADDVMRRAGYRENRDWVTRKFPGAEHSERSWRQRVDVPLIFLLGR
jgi:predicted alpha/beta superfamily hydrolase